MLICAVLIFLGVFKLTLISLKRPAAIAAALFVSLSLVHADSQLGFCHRMIRPFIYKDHLSMSYRDYLHLNRQQRKVLRFISNYNPEHNSVSQGKYGLNFGVIEDERKKDLVVYRSSYLGSKGIIKLQNKFLTKFRRFPGHIIHLATDGQMKDSFLNKPEIKYATQEKMAAKKLKIQYYEDGNQFTIYNFLHEINTPGNHVFTRVRRVFEIILDPKRKKGPVLIHCFHGIHRTGAIGLIFRYLQGGMWTQKLTKKIMAHGIEIDNLAKAELLYYGGHAKKDPYLAGYISFIDVFSKSREFQELLKMYEEFPNKEGDLL